MNFTYGSTVYGTDTEQSDIDIAMVGACEDSHADTHYPSLGHFVDAIRKCDPIALECYSLQFHPELAHFYDTNMRIVVPYIDKSVLRSSISSKASNSFVKAKKKLTVEKDYDRYASMKSLFHSIRLLMFGRQIAERGYVYDFKVTLPLWERITNDYEKMDDADVLVAISSIYKPIFNSEASAFRLLAPKE